MSNVYILGCGGHGRVILDVLRSTTVGGGENSVRFLDDCESVWGTQVDQVRVAGSPDMLRPGDELYLGIGDNIRRANLYRQYKALGCAFPRLIAPSATVSPRAVIDEGVMVFPGAVVQTGARLHANVIINTRAVVEHDNVIEPHVQLGPGVTLGGNVHVGEGTLLGIGVSVNRGVRIGSYCILSPGLPVIHDVGSGEVHKIDGALVVVEENYRVWEIDLSHLAPAVES